MHSDQLRDLLEAQQQIIKQIALQTDLHRCLRSICLQIESILQESHAKASILLLEGNVLHHGAAPSLPDSYNEKIDGLVIGPGVGSCGTAAFTKKQVIVSDIATDPFWSNFKDIAAAHELKACWSTPIFSSRDEVLGTFAIYYPYVASPTEYHQELIARFANFASLSIEREQAHQRETRLLEQLALTNAKLEGLVEVIPDLVIVLDESGNYVDLYGAGA
ncbi:MAG TPA: GAF domain-containing protein, partial [Pseudomonadales bacterium]|nr:GAF domain-containing protein [Pseudomonadales bacterium]